MDPKLWGNLPDEVLLKIYKSLLIKDFYNLRMVCKEWNKVASKRRCFNDQYVLKPYFLIFDGLLNHDSSQILAYNASSGLWIWKNIPQLGFIFGSKIGDNYEAFVVEGVFFDGTTSHSHKPMDVTVITIFFHVHIDYRHFQAYDRRRLDDVKKIPALPQVEQSILGMMVDTSKRPYTFKLIMGNCNADTLILDSETNIWESRPSRMVRCKAPCPGFMPKSCVQLDGHMYVWTDLDEIQVYSLEEDKWSTLSAPQRHPQSSWQYSSEVRGLGHWDGVVYAVNKNKQGTLSVWKLMNRVTQNWSKFEQIPSQLFSYLKLEFYGTVIFAAHCNEYFLIHVRFWDVCKEYYDRRFVLFNISNKRWEIVDLDPAQLQKRQE